MHTLRQVLLALVTGALVLFPMIAFLLIVWAGKC